ncbi:hypothetical protein PIROE2DRAFT_7568, partial [Piromyces sp. E2]
GFSSQESSGFYFEETIIQNCYFEDGLINFDSRDSTKVGKFDLLNVSFIDVKGGILIIKYIGDNSNVEGCFTGCYFEGNLVTPNGGVIYSLSNRTSTHITFNNNTFVDITDYGIYIIDIT